MRASSLIPFLGFALNLFLTYALATNSTALNSSLSELMPRKYNPLQNPYPVPGTEILLNFAAPPGAILSQKAVLAILTKVRVRITKYIHDNGDAYISRAVHTVNHQGLRLSYASGEDLRLMFYSEVLAVLRGMMKKMAQEGYRERTAIVLHDLNPEPLVRTGEVGIWGIRPPGAQTAES
ncbi:MAG: hypothetical protein L6R40_007454 [Gallowayella cf. fulva]|nr:MAG: hypothetical protein L6R40_007454 [Xanthomendoza cf. fulva]